MSTPETKRLCLRVWNRSSSGGTRPPSNQFASFHTAVLLIFWSRKHSALNGVHLIRIDGAVYVDCFKWNIAKGIYLVFLTAQSISRCSQMFDVLR
ncbi:hypothetical protein F0236_19805 [Vibrio splendidus]|nr:hypothetical protein [Vibrio splendidus]